MEGAAVTSQNSSRRRAGRGFRGSEITDEPRNQSGIVHFPERSVYLPDSTFRTAGVASRFSLVPIAGASRTIGV